jgi:hypothetical protein
MGRGISRTVGAWSHEHPSRSPHRVPAVTNPTPPNQPGQSADYPPGPGSPPPNYPPPGAPGYGPPPQGYGQPPGPPPKKGGGGKTVLIILAVIFGGMILLCGVGGVLIANAPKTTTTERATGATPGGGQDTPAAPVVGASKDNPAPIGTPVSPAKDWTVVVNSANLNATPEIVAANMFNKPRVATNQLVSVNVSVRNGSDRPGSPMSNLNMGALTPAGVKVEPAFAVTGIDTLKSTQQLQPGGTLTGLLVFELAPADIPQTVLLAEPQLTLDTNEDQRFLAIQ